MADTQKEKALKVVAKLIKDIDTNTLLLDTLKDGFLSLGVGDARQLLFNIIKQNDLELTKDYKLVPKIRLIS